MTPVIFACVENAGRSQKAATFFNALADPSKAHAIFGGTAPAAHLAPEVVAAMPEGAVDISGATPRLPPPERPASAQLLVTMGCGDACPFVPSLRREDWSLDDPKGQPPEGERAIRDEIQQPVQRLIEAEGWGRP